jgi:hypothetical protein
MLACRENGLNGLAFRYKTVVFEHLYHQRGDWLFIEALAPLTCLVI